jgi:hypothetical protein
MNTVQECIKNLETVIIRNPEDLYEVEDLCDELENNPDKHLAIKALFTFMENNDSADLGSPGYVVKLLETFPEIYKSELYESINRKATYYNLWMLNRYLNYLNNSLEKQKGLDLLASIANDNNQSKYIQERARDFLDNHK